MENTLFNTKLNTVSIDALRTNDGSYFIVPGATSEEMQPIISGSGLPNSRIDLYNGTTFLGSAQVDPAGHWQIQPDIQSLLIGNVSLIAQQNGASSGAFTFTAGAVNAPRATIQAVLAGDDVLDTDLAPGAKTADTTPTLLVTGRPYSQVTIFDNGYALKTLDLDDSGNASWTVNPALGTGEHAFSIQSSSQSTETAVWKMVVDASSDAPPIATPVTLDATALDNVGVSGKIVHGGTTDDTRPTFSGTAGAKELVTLYDENHQALGSTTTDENGRWSLEITQPLQEGSHEVTAQTATQTSNAFPLHVESTPSAPVTFSAVAYDNVGTASYFSSGGTTDDQRPGFSGTAGANQLVTIYDETGRELGSTRASPGGNWSMELSTSLSDGAHSLVAKSAGQVSSAFNLQVQTATEAPVTIGLYAYDDVNKTGYVASGATTDDTRPFFNGTASAGQLVTLFDETGHALGSVVAGANGRWALEITQDLSNGHHNVVAKTATQSSAAFELNIQSSHHQPLTMDRSAYDNVVKSGSFLSGSSTDDARPMFSGTATANQLVTLYDETGRALGSVTARANGLWSIEIQQDLSVGSHTVSAKSGSEITSGFQLNVVPVVTLNHTFIDNVGVRETLTSGVDSTNDTRPTFSGTAPAGSVVELVDAQGQVLGRVITATNGIWSKEITSDLHEGSNQIFARVNGYASESIEVNVETSAHVAMTIDRIAIDNVGTVSNIISGNMSMTDDNRPTFSGSAKVGELVTLHDHLGRELGSTTAGADGRWQLEIDVPLNQGGNGVSASAGGMVSNTFSLNVHATLVTTASSGEEKAMHLSSLLQDAEPALFASKVEAIPALTLPNLAEADMRVETHSGITVSMTTLAPQAAAEEYTHH